MPDLDFVISIKFITVFCKHSFTMASSPVLFCFCFCFFFNAPTGPVKLPAQNSYSKRILLQTLRTLLCHVGRDQLFKKIFGLGF